MNKNQFMGRKIGGNFKETTSSEESKPEGGREKRNKSSTQCEKSEERIDKNSSKADKGKKTKKKKQAMNANIKYGTPFLSRNSRTSSNEAAPPRRRHSSVEHVGGSKEKAGSNSESTSSNSQMRKLKPAQKKANKKDSKGQSKAEKVHKKRAASQRPHSAQKTLSVDNGSAPPPSSVTVTVEERTTDKDERERRFERGHTQNAWPNKSMYNENTTQQSVTSTLTHNTQEESLVSKSLAQSVQQSVHGSPDTSVQTPEAESSLKKTFTDFVKHCNSLNNDVLNYMFDNLPTARVNECEHSLLAKNTVFNRYHNIRCLDASRVKLRFLSKEVDSDYIHANHVNHPSLSNRFILTQGPLSRTVYDMWRMVWQEKAAYIFQLCKTVEGKKKKSAEYLPASRETPLICYPGSEYEIKVELVEKRTREDIQLIYSKCVVHYNGAEHTVTHCQWKGWPDCQAPNPTTNVLFTLLNHSRNSRGPTIVHCSAGIGRSGTLVAIELSLMEIARGKSPMVPSLVRSLRLCRANAVQTFEQFCFIYRSVLQFGVNNGFLQTKDFQTFSKVYDSICTRSAHPQEPID